MIPPGFGWAGIVSFAAFHQVRFWPKADKLVHRKMSAFGGKADMAFCVANVR